MRIPDHARALTRPWIAAAALGAGGCHGPAPATAPMEEVPAAPAADLDGLVRAYVAEAREVPVSSMLDDLAAADVVFLGETHLDEVTHLFEVAVLEGLADRRGGRVVLAMEMFGTDDQPALDAYLAGRIDEPAFLERSSPWKNYRTGYRPLVEAARRSGLPVIGSNIPDALREKISRGGREAFESLTPSERALLPPALHPGAPEYWQRFERAVAGHMDRSTQQPDPQAMLYSVQSLWDNTMGWSCARALQRHPGYLVLHVNGGFHTQYRQGTVEQLRLRRPDASIATVSVVPAADLAAPDTRNAGRAADYLVFAQQRARGIQEGFHAVDAARELRYRLRVPAGASEGAAVPLLVWLPPEGVRSADAESFWHAALADEAALAIVEPPYPQIEEDLHAGGRWYWTETFHDDVSALVRGLQRIVAYVCSYYPVDASRVVVGGAGAAGTAVAVAALESDRLPVRAIAMYPARASRLIERPVPDLRPPTIGLAVITGPEECRAWEDRCAAYRAAGLDASVAEGGGDLEAGAERAVRDALGLPPPPAPATRLPLLATSDTPLGLFWARVCARWMERDGRGVDLVGPGELASLDPAARRGMRVLAFAGEAAQPAAEEPGLRFFTVEDLADARAIPTPAGPFGGTTVVVVPASAPPSEREGWRDLERGDAMQQVHGRFYRLAVAFEGEDPTLPQVLEALREKGRINVLVVPAMFCADAAFMRRLETQARGVEGRMNLSWLPGLGGRIHLAVSREDQPAP
jgi:uncharacterized iron-regulated protein